MKKNNTLISYTQNLKTKGEKHPYWKYYHRYHCVAVVEGFTGRGGGLSDSKSYEFCRNIFVDKNHRFAGKSTKSIILKCNHMRHKDFKVKYEVIPHNLYIESLEDGTTKVSFQVQRTFEEKS